MARKYAMRIGWTVMAALFLAVFPLWQGGTYSHITLDKWHGMQILTGSALAVGLAAFCRQKDRLKALRLSLPQALMLACLAWLGLAAFFGAWHEVIGQEGQPAVWIGARRYEGMSTQLCYGLIFLLISLHPADQRWLLPAAAAAALLFGLTAGLQNLGVNVLGLYPTGRSILTNYEFQGTIGNIDMNSAYLSLAVPLLLGGWVIGSNWSGLLLAGGLTGLLLMLFMEVQGGVLAMALLLALLVCWAAAVPEHRARALIALGGALLCVFARGCIALPWLDGSDAVSPRMPGVGPLLCLPLGAGCLFLSTLKKLPALKAAAPRRIALIALICAAVLIAGIALIPIPEDAGGLWELHEVLNGRVQESFGSYRLGVWGETLRMDSGRLLFGDGPDTFWFAFADHMRSVGKSYPERFDNPHNLYLQVLSAGGLPALLLYLALLGSLLADLLRGLKGHPTRLPLLLALVCYLTQGFFSFSICLVSPIFWTVAGLAAGEAAAEKKTVTV